MTQFVFVDDICFPCESAAHTVSTVCFAWNYLNTISGIKPSGLLKVFLQQSRRQGKAFSADTEIVGLRERE